MRDPEVVEGPTRPICPPSDPGSCLPHPRGVVPAPLPYQDITHRTRNRLTTPLRTQSRRGTPVSPSVNAGAFLRFARPTPHGRRRHRLVRAALCSRCRTCSARQVRGRLCCRIGGAAAGSQCEATAEVKHSKRSGLSRWCFIVSPASVLLGVLSDFRAVNCCVHLCVLASCDCSRMGGPGPRLSDRIFLVCHLPGIIFTIFCDRPQKIVLLAIEAPVACLYILMKPERTGK